MCIIFISTQIADTVWEKIQKYKERDRVCEKDEKTKKRTKTETACFLPAPQECLSRLFDVLQSLI